MSAPRRIMSWLMVVGFTLVACQPNIVTVPVTVEVPITEIVQHTQIVPITATFPPAPSFVIPHPILADLRVRRGIVHCTNRAELLRSVYPWLTDPAQFEMDSFLPREHWAYPGDSSLAHYPFDPEKGKAMFEEAGWALQEGAPYRINAAGEEMALKLTTTTSQFRQTWVAVFEEQMGACGLRLIRLHAPAAWFFGDTTGLARRDFELAGYASMTQADPGGRTLFACDQIPSPDNGWRGQNLTGWCDPEADAAIRAATSSLDRDTRREAYRIVQEQFAQDPPSIPLFSRVEVNATNPALENFAPPTPGEVYTWNAAQWVVPGKETLVIGESSEPASLFLEDAGAYVSQVIQALISGKDYTSLSYDYQPVMLTQLPTLENGAATNNRVEVRQGESVIDADGNVVELKPGVHIRDAEGSVVGFEGEAIQMKQLVVRFEFVPGLTWSDGAPVSKADYELGYRVMCDPAANEYIFGPAPAVCEKAAGVEFVSDTAYLVKWTPGYQDPLYFLPPITRRPAHQKIADGRKLADVPVSQWFYRPELMHTPLGVGPYRVKEWEFGKQMVLEANPFYYQGPPATPRIVVRFVERNKAVLALIAGEVDVLGWDTIGPEEAERLLAAQTAGQARVYLTPSNTHEQVDFALFVP